MYACEWRLLGSRPARPWLGLPLQLLHPAWSDMNQYFFQRYSCVSTRPETAPPRGGGGGASACRPPAAAGCRRATHSRAPQSSPTSRGAPKGTGRRPYRRVQRHAKTAARLESCPAAARHTQRHAPSSLAAGLQARGVEHNPARASNRRRRQVLAELAAHKAVVAVSPADLAPDHAELAALDLPLRLVDVRNPAHGKGGARSAAVALSAARAPNACAPPAPRARPALRPALASGGACGRMHCHAAQRSQIAAAAARGTATVTTAQPAPSTAALPPPGCCAPLAHVEFSVLLRVNVLDLDERLVLVLVDLAPASGGRVPLATESPCRQAGAAAQRRRRSVPLVAEDAALAVERARLTHLLDLRERGGRRGEEVRR